MADTFASGRYSKRKRTQVNYIMEELDVSDAEPEFEPVPAKKRKASTTTKRMPKKKTFPFLNLPAEIRNMIYGLVLTDPNGINLVGTFKNLRRTVERVSADGVEKMGAATHRYYGITNQINDNIRAEAEAPRLLCPSLLAVNKQLLSECRDLLYSNQFVFIDTQALYSFLMNIGTERTKSLKYIELKGWGSGRGLKAYNHACFALLAPATNLETLHLNATSSYVATQIYRANQLYRDAFPWLESYGAAHGKPDAAVDVLKFEMVQYGHTIWRNGVRTTIPREEAVEALQHILRTLLVTQHKRVMAPISRKKKKVAPKGDEQ